jgi:hypothetical protein
MKRFIAAIIAFVLVSTFTPAIGEQFDLSGLSFEQLVSLRDQINLAIWNCQEWQEVSVPAGVWVIGQDIPAGHWTIRPASKVYTNVAYCDRLDKYGKRPGSGWLGWNGTLAAEDHHESTANERHEVDLIMEEGMYFINRDTCIFTPYAGKPDLGFK